MLQRIRDGIGRWVFGIIVGLIALSFVFWGIDFDASGPSYAAKVNGNEISLVEFERELQNEQSRFQDLYRLDLTEDVRRMLRGTVLDRLVRQAALLERVEERGYRVSNSRLFEYVTSVPVFQVNGQFSMSAYQGQIAVQGMTQTGFENRTRAQLELLDLQTGIFDTAFLAPYEFERYIELANQRRRVGYAIFEVDAFIDQVEITDEALAEHYDANRSRYMTEEAVELEYVELLRDDVAAGIEVSEEQLRDHFERMSDRYRVEEERSASHILIVPGDDETDEDAQARAAALYERIQAGESFDELAAEHSDDPGTAELGGDLGWIGRGMLPGPFEDELYALERGDVSEPVSTDFGYHLIRFDDVREGQEQSFEDVRDELLVEYRASLADDRFYDLARQLGDSAFDAYDSLEPVAQQTGLMLKRLERFPRSGDPEAFPNNGPVVDAVFGVSAPERGENSELIEIGDGHVAVVRVARHFDPEQRPLAEVSDEIREDLTRERAAALASEAAEAFASALPASPDDGFFGAADATGATAEPNADGGSDPAMENGEDAQAADAESATAEATDDGDTAVETGESTGTAATAPVAALANEHGGRWVGPLWVTRANASVPTELLGSVFDAPAPDDAAQAVAPQQVTMASGDQALFVLLAIEPGQAGGIAAEERVAVQQQLLERAGEAELGAYAESVSGQAKVTIPPDVMDPSF